MLTVDQIIELEVRISDEIENLEAESVSTAVEREAISPDVSIGRLSRLDSMQIQEIAKETQRRRDERLPRLKDALDRIDMDEYGKCNGCRQWIAFARLKEQPEAPFCGSCA